LFLNHTVFRIMDWFYGTNSKTLADLDRLVNDVLLADDFNREDLHGFSAQCEVRHLDNASANSRLLDSQDGWIKADIKLNMSATKYKHTSEQDAPQITVEGVFYREIYHITTNRFKDVTGLQSHQAPFHEYWNDPNNPDAPPVRVYSELYNSDAVVEE
ncbi:hypothetical protein BC834DRAFT_800939, partial [Gloeopeniophorella convolvens]